MLHPDTHPADSPSSSSLAPELLRSAGARELRELAYDLVGRPEHDELSIEERERLATEVEEAVALVLAEPAARATLGGSDIAARLRAALSARVEELPLHLRVTLANARRRQLLGYD